MVKDKPKQGSGRRKKPYARPEVRQVPLKPEEAVLGFCKQSEIFGPGTTSCGVGVSICYSTGS